MECAHRTESKNQKHVPCSQILTAFLIGSVSGGRNSSILLRNQQATPNTSGTMQTVPSLVQPSPTVHTKEALGKYVVSFQNSDYLLCRT